MKERIVWRQLLNVGNSQRGLTRYGWLALVGASLLVLGFFLSIKAGRARAVRLPDGTRFRLALVVFTNSFSYTQNREPTWMRRVSWLVPGLIQQHFRKPGARIVLGSSTESNLMVVFEARSQGGSLTPHIQLRVRDEDGNSYDGNSTSGVLSTPSGTTFVWRLPVTPNRSRRLSLEPIVCLTNGVWTNLGPFTVRNPRFGRYPQWKAKPLPQSATNGKVVATLQHLRCGPLAAPWARGAPQSLATPQSTWIEFTFAKSGRLVNDYRIHQLTIADATGNHWSPYLNAFSQKGAGWKTNGVAEFVGALWPGEHAWKIKLAVLRSATFARGQVWAVRPIRLPNPQTYTALTNRFERGDLKAALADLAAPGVQLTNSWKWIVRYWGNAPSVYGLALKFDGLKQHRRPIVVAAVDQRGRHFNLVEHRGTDSTRQALFLQAPPAATQLRLTLAFPQLRGFQFLARPEFERSAPAVAGSHGSSNPR